MDKNDVQKRMENDLEEAIEAHYGDGVGDYTNMADYMLSLGWVLSSNAPITIYDKE